MLGRLKRFACKFDSPFLNLLILDWRFTCLLLLLLVFVLAAISAPLKLWKRNTSGKASELRISTIDWLQALALSRSARCAEQRNDFESAIASWSMALANDPANERIGINYLNALLRSSSPTNLVKALQAGSWLQAVSTNRVVQQLSIEAAARLHDWPRVLTLSRDGADAVQFPADQQFCVVRALFHTGQFAKA